MKASVSTVAALTLLYLAPSAYAQKLVAQQEFSPEEYTQEGQTNGCGISVLAVWPADSGGIIGVSQSINFFFVPEHKNVMAVLKASAILNGKQVPISYAWIETAGYGRTTDFTKGPAEDLNAYIAAKNTDPKTMMLVLDEAERGSTLGITIKGDTLDSIAKLPPAPSVVVSKVQACFTSLTERMKKVAGQ